MKQQTLINILIFFMFAAGFYFIIKPLIAELHFDNAQNLKVQYRWSKAAEECRKAAAFDSSNAKYHSELGRLYMMIGRFGQDKAGWCLKAEEEYKKAIKLNPVNGTYYLDLGKVQFELLPDKADISSAEIVRCIDNLKHAVELEPHNYYVHATAGYYCLSLVSQLDSAKLSFPRSLSPHALSGERESRKDRGFALSKLQYALELNPSYSKDVYSAVWKKFGDFALLQKITPDNLTGQQELLSFIQEVGLWQYRKKQADLVKTYKEKEQPRFYKQEQLAKSKEIEALKSSLGSAESTNTVTEYVSRDKWRGRAGGNMYWTGTIHTLILSPKGRGKGEGVSSTKEKIMISIQAAGSPANDVYPYMIVELDGEEIGEAYVNSSEWKDYSFEIETGGGKKVLSVSFINDGGNESKKEDRNLYVGDVKIN